MKHILLTTIIALSFVLISSLSFAEEKPSWKDDFISALVKGKQGVENPTEALGFTPSEATVLEQAIKKAMGQNAPECEMMTTAVDLKYSPYVVLKTMASTGNKIGLTQLCMCATEHGIEKSTIASATEDATGPDGNPVFSREEITQAQCYSEPVVELFRSQAPKIPVSLDLPRDEQPTGEEITERPEIPNGDFSNGDFDT